MQRMLKHLIAGAVAAPLAAGLALADSTIAELPLAPGGPLVGACIPVDVGPGTDAKLCGNYAAAFGLSAVRPERAQVLTAGTVGTIAGTTEKMLFGGLFTPKTTGDVWITFRCSASNDVSAAGNQIKPYYAVNGSPAQPVLNDSVPGGATAFGIIASITEAGANNKSWIAGGGLLTSLVVGTEYWAWVSGKAIVSGNALFTDCQFLVLER